MSILTLDLPVRSKVWRAYGNAVQGAEASGSVHAAQSWVIIKNLMFGVPAPGLVCAGSSDAATAGLDGVDRIVDKTKVISNAAGAHSWQVIESAADGWQLCIDFNTANNWTATMVWSPGGNFTGGSTTARPTATDEIVNKSAGDWTIGNATTRLNWVLLITDDGQNFALLGTTTTALSVSWMAGRIQDVRPWVTSPFYCNQMAGVTLSTPSRYAAPSVTSDYFSARGPTSPFTVRLQCTAQFNFSGFIFDLAPVVSSFTGQWEFEQPGLINRTAPDYGRWGSLPDHLFLVGPAHGSILQSPSDRSRVAIRLGCWLLPWPLNSVWTVP
jgi:hypothetical protein